MKKIFILLVSFMVYLGIYSDMVFAGININALGARKELDEDWQNLDKQDEWGAIIDFKADKWPIGFEVSYLYASEKDRSEEIIEDGDDVFDRLRQEAITEEASIGLKQIWGEEDGLAMFLSAGPTWIKGEISSVDDFDDSEVGWYASSGIYFIVLKMINIGGFVRYSDSNLDIRGTELEAGGWHYGILAGIHFG